MLHQRELGTEIKQDELGRNWDGKKQKQCGNGTETGQKKGQK
jgi:hypothetical protein